jgi:hypothetical protein
MKEHPMSTDGSFEVPDEQYGDEDDFTIDPTPMPRGRTRLTVRRGDEVIHIDTIDLGRADDRRRFGGEAARRLGVAPEVIEGRLLDMFEWLDANTGAAVEEESDGAAEPPAEAASWSDAQVLVDLAAGVDLFHTEDGRAYATVLVSGHAETFAVRSHTFRLWLVQEFRRLRRRPPGAEALGQAVQALEAAAQLDGPLREVHIRIAVVVDPADPDHPTIYWDLVDAERRAVRITAGGWEVIAHTPVRFIRPRGMLPLPVPQPGGGLDDLWHFVNLPGRHQRRLYLAWLLTALRGRGPYPILIISGVQGSAKSTTQRVARELIDPHAAVDRAPPRDVRDLMIAATNCAVLTYDNLSYLPDWLSDSLCRLSTGAAFTTRELYTNDEEFLFCARRPVILNAIPDIAGQGDVLDRSVLLDLPAIPARRRVAEQTFWADFVARLPALLGELLDVMVRALRIEPTIERHDLPRMADFAVWGEAVCRAAGEPAGAFMTSYRANRREAAAIALESSPVAGAVLALLRDQPQWEGEAGALLALLPEYVEAGGGRGRQWPQTPRAMGSALRRIAPALRACGVIVEFRIDSGHDRRRLITIRRAAQDRAGRRD